MSSMRTARWRMKRERDMIKGLLYLFNNPLFHECKITSCYILQRTLWRFRWWLELCWRWAYCSSKTLKHHQYHLINQGVASVRVWPWLIHLLFLLWRVEVRRCNLLQNMYILFSARSVLALIFCLLISLLSHRCSDCFVSRMFVLE